MGTHSENLQVLGELPLEATDVLVFPDFQLGSQEQATRQREADVSRQKTKQGPALSCSQLSRLFGQQYPMLEC